MSKEVRLKKYCENYKAKYHNALGGTGYSTHVCVIRIQKVLGVAQLAMNEFLLYNSVLNL